MGSTAFKSKTMMAATAAAVVALAVFTVFASRGRAAPQGSSPASQPDAAALRRPPAESMRALGFRLVTVAEASEVRAGIATLTQAAEGGDVEAQVALGRIYLQGLPAIPKNPPRAREWFLRADVKGHASAAYFLGVLSQSDADAEGAARWFEVGTRRGSPHAMFFLANAYRAGAGVPKDDAKAVALYKMASEMEHPAALQTLAMAYQRGELGLDADDDEARRYAMEAEHAIEHPPMLP